MSDPFFEAVDTLSRESQQGESPADPRRPTLIPELEPYWEKYTAGEYQQDMEPLRVIIRIDGVMAGYDNPTFDGILARMVTDEALDGETLDGSGSPYLLPVPLYKLWTDPETGLPLWASTHFHPIGPNEEVSYFWHKRGIQPHHAKKKKGQRTPYLHKGRHKEKRVPVPAQTAKAWWADCIGDPGEVERLYSRLEVMGKKRRALVRSIEVRRIDQFQMDRPVPMRYFDEETKTESHGYMGWTPPYWAGVPAVQAECAVPLFQRNRSRPHTCP